MAKPKLAPCGRAEADCECGPQWQRQGDESWIIHYTHHCEGCGRLYNSHDEYGGAGICPRCSRRGLPPQEPVLVAPEGMVLVPIGVLREGLAVAEEYDKWRSRARTEAAAEAATEMRDLLAHRVSRG